MNNNKIRSGIMGNFEIMEFEPTFKQSVIIQNIRIHQYNIIRKSRQVGLSTTLAVEMLDFALSIPNSSLVYVGCNVNSIVYFRDMVLSLKSNISANTNNKQEIVFNNGSSIKFITKSSQLSNINRVDWLVIDEAAFNTECGIMVGMAVRFKGCKITLSSTPAPERTYFNEVYVRTMRGGNDFIITDYLWYDHPVFGSDVYWVRDYKDTEKVYDYGDPHNIIRLMEIGYIRMSDNYKKHLTMYGFDSPHRRFEFDAVLA